ncbi:MAG: alpha-amylase [Spirochaetae bacterium HGW-Spirochaetae-8]|nr:MAG: alpha-amylase [Spirochaetae bacterium HGW-Spirochaetae-8]
MDFKAPLFASAGNLDGIYEQAKTVSHLFNSRQQELGRDSFISVGKMNAAGVLHIIYQTVISRYLFEQDHDFFTRFSPQVARNHACQEVLVFYSKEFPSPLLQAETPNIPYFMEETARGFFVHQVLLENPALLKAVRPFVKPVGLTFPTAAQALAALMGGYTRSAPRVGDNEEDLFTFLTEPARLHPDSMMEQIRYIARKWKDLIPENLHVLLLRAVDYITEEEKPRFTGGAGPSIVPSYRNQGIGNHEFEAYSSDKSWMPNVVMLAKSTLVWLDQLSRYYGYPITTLDSIPDRELDLLAERGFSSLWLIGLWERSPASRRIKNLCGNPEAEASAYSLKGYDIAESIGGWQALKNLDGRCRQRHIRLASDMVPNHTGLDSDWVLHHPEYFIQAKVPPFPAYSFNGENLSPDPGVEIKLEDHYFDKTDAAVTFRRRNLESQETSYIFHGNDGTSMPWNDTAQLDFLNPATREAVIQQILHVAHNFHIIRFDAAMTLARKHVQRLWYPSPGTGGDVPGRASAGLSEEEFNAKMPKEFWREVVDRVAAEVPDTLLLAEAFWMMEGYFVRTLGMHRVYNSAFMHMLKNQDNKKYRDTIKNTISFDPEVLKRFVNFMNNPDEETAVAQFGNGDKYFGVCTLLVTMPGLPMFGHGQVEGFHEKYGMEYRKAYWNEYPDEHLVKGHERLIFPLVASRHLFSGVDYFELFDAVDNEQVVESIFAYVNGSEDSRALVLYNNQFEAVQGRLNTSCPKLHRLPNGARETRTVTLAESLGLKIGGRRYAIYDNFSDGLTYITPSMTVYDEGFWVTLSGYETRVLLHIREVEDFDGTYEALCNQLDGRGTGNFAEDLQAVRLAPLFKAMDNFRSPEMLKFVDALVAGNSTAAMERKFILLAGEAYARLASEVETMEAVAKNNLPGNIHDVDPLLLVREIHQLNLSFSHKKVSEEKPQSIEHTLLSAGGAVMVELPFIFNAYLMTKPFLAPGDGIDETAAVVEDLLLTHFFTNARETLHVDTAQLRHLLQGAVLLAATPEFLLEARTYSKTTSVSLLKQLFDLPFFARFVGCNEYQGVLWYRKESFQEALFLLCLGSILRNGESSLAPLYTFITDWLRKDLVAEYQVGRLIEQEKGFNGYN